jgi:hypothetical protein
MSSRLRLRSLAIVVVLLLTIGGGVSFAGSYDPPTDEQECTAVVDETQSDETQSDETQSDADETDGTETDGTETDGTETDGTETDGTETDGCTDEDAGDIEDADDVGSAGGSDEDDATTGDEPVDPAREAECNEAAGVEITEPAEGEETDAVEAPTHGIDHAIEVVLANCIKNPQAPGLVNALEHLVINRDRHEARVLANAERKAAHDAAQAERKAAHDAAQAERKAAHDEAKAARDAEHAAEHADHGNPHNG